MTQVTPEGFARAIKQIIELDQACKKNTGYPFCDFWELILNTALVYERIIEEENSPPDWAKCDYFADRFTWVPPNLREEIRRRYEDSVLSTQWAFESIENSQATPEQLERSVELLTGIRSANEVTG